MQQFMSKEETDKVKIKCNINVFQDLLNIKENYPWFSLISIYPTEAETQNLVNDKVLEDYCLKNHVFYINCNFKSKKFDKPERIKADKYFFVEDYKGDNFLKIFNAMCKKNNITLYSLQSFKQTIDNVQIDKTKYSFCEKIGIIQNAYGYLGTDTSVFAPIAYRYKKNCKLCILADKEKNYVDTMIRFQPCTDIDFTYNNLGEFIEDKSKWPEESES